MKLTGTCQLTAAVNKEERRIIGQVVPFGEQGTPAKDGVGIELTVEAGGLVWDADDMPKLRAGQHHTTAIGRAVTMDASPTGIVAAFKVANTQAGTDALTLAAEGLQVGMSWEADGGELTANRDGSYTLTAANPAKMSAVLLTENPAFTSAQVTHVAATKEKVTMTETTTEETVDTSASDLTAAITKLTEQLSAPKAEELPERLTASTIVNREPFPYGHPGADGKSLFQDLMNASRNQEAAIRAEKAQAMMAEVSKPRGAQLIAANEPTVRSTLVVPNVYDPAHYVEELVNPRVIADHVPGVSVDKPNPIVIPSFTSSFADGGSGEPVQANASEGVNPAQAEIATTTITVTPVLYTGLYDVSREAVDAGTPATEALILRTLMNSYNESTEAAAVTAILANGTAGTDSVSDAGTTTVEPRNMQAAIRLEMAKMNVGLKQAPDAILFASDVYQVAVGADTATAGQPLYSFMADRFTIVNQTSNIDPDMTLAVYGRPGYLAHKLTATKVVVVKWAGVIRFESPTQTFTYDQPVGPAAVRFALSGYFAQRTLQAQAVRYFAQA